MAFSIRRIVTTNDADGKAVIATDTEIEGREGRPGAGEARACGAGGGEGEGAGGTGRGAAVAGPEDARAQVAEELAGHGALDPTVAVQVAARVDDSVAVAVHAVGFEAGDLGDRALVEERPVRDVDGAAQIDRGA